MLTLSQVDTAALAQLLWRFGLQLCVLAPATSITGSYWGESEAGLLGSQLYARADTPLHSVLHEASHYICMDRERRGALNTDAGGDFAEEDAVCYLQGLLADQLPGHSRQQQWADMDAWGYTFRLGSARAWFEQDAQEARQWLLARGLIDQACRPTGMLRL